VTDRATVEDLAMRGATAPAPASLRALYREALQDFGARALWSSRPVDQPTIADLLAITESLRVEGGVSGRRLAEQIIAACRAALELLVAPVAPVGGPSEPGKLPTIHSAEVRSDADGTLLEWVVASS